MNIGFRVDGGKSIGMGHIMRCISLANEFRENGYDVYFIGKHKEGIDKITDEGFKIIGLEYTENKNIDVFSYGDKTKLFDEANDIIEAIYRFNIDLLFIDSYNVSKEYFLQLKPHVKKLAYIDDINKFIYPVDILINGNITAKYMDYKKYYTDEIFLLGPKYNLIREEFRELPGKKIKREVKEIMITTGGSDPYNITIKLLGYILKDNKLKQLTYNVVVGNGFIHKDSIKNIGKSHTNINIYENPEKMSQIMLKSDIAISSGGSTLYELCACGIPIIVFIYADNQRFMVKKMTELGYIESLGWHEDLDEQNVVLNLKDLIFSYNRRIKLSRHGKKLVDGNGSKRVIKKIESLS